MRERAVRFETFDPGHEAVVGWAFAVGGEVATAS